MTNVPGDHELEARIVELWREALGLAKVSPNDDFFSIGGDSLLAVQLALQLRQITGKAVPPDALYRAPTVHALARLVGAAKGCVAAVPSGPSGPINPTVIAIAPEHEEFLDPNFWDFEDMNGRIVVRFTGKLDAQRLQQAVDRLVARHDALRMKVVTSGEKHVFRGFREYSIPIRSCVYDRLRTMDDLKTGEQLAFFDEVVEELDPTRDPLVSLKLAHLKDESVLLMKINHLVFDQHSARLWFQEIDRAYTHPEEEFEQLAYCYGDFLAEASRGHAEAVSYWRERLKGGASTFLRDLDRSAPKRYAQTDTIVNTQSYEHQQLLSACRSVGVSEFCVLFSLFQVALRRVSHQDRVLVSSTSAGRTRVEQMGTIGSFRSNVLFDANVSLRSKFKEILTRTAADIDNAYSYLHISRRELQEFSQRDDLVSFNVTPRSVTERRITGDAISSVEALSRNRLALEYDLGTHVYLSADHMRFRYSYNAQRMPRHAVEGIVAFYENLLSDFLRNPTDMMERHIQLLL